MNRRKPFDLNAALPKAAAVYLLHALKTHTPYITASDLENQVRRFADEQMNGEAWGTNGAAWGRGFGASIKIRIDGPGTLSDVCWRWLARQERTGKLRCDRLGRVLRYRPAQQPLSEAEQRTLAKHAVPWNERPAKPVHATKGGKLGNRILCARPWKPGMYIGRPSRNVRKTVMFEKVTCPRCLKLIKAQQAEQQAKDVI